MRPIYLGVNIDHVATVRNARGTDYPDPVTAAAVAELAGADSITTHLREDRRHITDRDVRIIRETIKTALNLEMSVNDDILAIAVALAPHKACLVPERREEITTEGGLNVVAEESRIKAAVDKLSAVGTACSLFIDPEREQVEAAQRTGAPFVEFHTGRYANAKSEQDKARELSKLSQMAALADSLGLGVNSGHGLNYQNVAQVAAIPQMHELNIGHSIIGRAIFTGLDEAVRTMKEIMLRARAQASLKD